MRLVGGANKWDYSWSKPWKGFPGGALVKNRPASAGDTGDMGLIPWVGRIPWKRKWQPTPVFLSGKSHGQRSLVGYSPWGRKESDTTERLSMSTKAWKLQGLTRVLGWGGPGYEPGSEQKCPVPVAMDAQVFAPMRSIQQARFTVTVMGCGNERGGRHSRFVLRWETHRPIHLKKTGQRTGSGLT